LLSKKTREQVYEPHYNEILEDYTLAKRTYRTKCARRWLTFCFSVKTLGLFVESIITAIGDRFIRRIEKTAPTIVHWWLRK